MLKSIEVTPILEKFFEPTKELLDQILRFTTRFESVSARLALELVSKVLCLVPWVLSEPTLYLGALAP